MVAELDIQPENGNELYQFLIQGIGITVTALFGIIGNILSLIVITRPKLKSSITWLLIGLTFFDLMFLILNILMASLVSTFTYMDIGEGYISAMDPGKYPFLAVAFDTAQTASIYFTIFIALERYLVVKWPIESRSFCTYERCRILALIVAILSCAYQGVRFLTTSSNHEPRDSNNDWLLHCLQFGLTNSSEPRPEEEYESYNFRWPYMTFIMIIPSILLIFLNGSIWHTVVMTQRKKKLQLTNKASKKSDQREQSITTMLLVVVLVFLLCQLCFYIMAFIHAVDKCAWKVASVYLISVDYYMITLNSSVNFLIYCTFGTNFRKEFQRLLCIQKVRETMGLGNVGDSSSGAGATRTTPLIKG